MNKDDCIEWLDRAAEAIEDMKANFDDGPQDFLESYQYAQECLIKSLEVLLPLLDLKKPRIE